MPNTERASLVDRVAAAIIKNPPTLTSREYTDRGWSDTYSYERTADAAIAVCMEEAARVAEAADHWSGSRDVNVACQEAAANEAAHDIASAIRSLIPTSEAG